VVPAFALVVETFTAFRAIAVRSLLRRNVHIV